jgi:hypothetical protein
MESRKLKWSQNSYRLSVIGFGTVMGILQVVYPEGITGSIGGRFIKQWPCRVQVIGVTSGHKTERFARRGAIFKSCKLKAESDQFKAEI